MLPSVGIVKVLCNSLREFPVRGISWPLNTSTNFRFHECQYRYVFSSVAALVVDPVMVSTSGDILSAPSTLAEYRYAYFPFASELLK